MSSPTLPSPDDLARQLQVVADPNRLRILRLLLAGERCNCDLGDDLGLAPNLVSHHLKVLRQAGLIDARRDPHDARWVHYAADRAALARLVAALAAFLDPPPALTAASACRPRGGAAVATFSVGSPPIARW
jgi:ArsR family transcriptional regulator